MSSSDTSALLYKVRAPSDPTAPLAFFVHGRAGNFDVMSVFKRCIPESWGIVFPQAPLEDASKGGFSWWQIAEAAADEDTITAKARLIDEQEALHSARRFIHFVKKIKAELAPEARTLVAVGFSQGGALLSLVAKLEPELFSAVAMLSSFVLVREEEALSPKFPRFFVAHGAADNVIPVALAHNGVAKLRASGVAVHYVEEPALGHKIGATSMKELSVWIQST